MREDFLGPGCRCYRFWNGVKDVASRREKYIVSVKTYSRGCFLHNAQVTTEIQEFVLPSLQRARFVLQAFVDLPFVKEINMGYSNTTVVLGNARYLLPVSRLKPLNENACTGTSASAELYWPFGLLRIKTRNKLLRLLN